MSKMKKLFKKVKGGLLAVLGVKAFLLLISDKKSRFILGLGSVGLGLGAVLFGIGSIVTAINPRFDTLIIEQESDIHE